MAVKNQFWALTPLNHTEDICDLQLTLCKSGQREGAATAEEIMEDASAIAAAIGNLTGSAAEEVTDVLREISVFNDTCQGDSGGPLFIKGDLAVFSANYQACPEGLSSISSKPLLKACLSP